MAAAHSKTFGLIKVLARDVSWTMLRTGRHMGHVVLVPVRSSCSATTSKAAGEAYQHVYVSQMASNAQSWKGAIKGDPWLALTYTVSPPVRFI
jgi:hypothetical protein